MALRRYSAPVGTTTPKPTRNGTLFSPAACMRWGAASSVAGLPLLLVLLLGTQLVLLHAPTAAAKPAARKEDVPLIRCDVCRHVAANVLRQVQQQRRRAAPRKLSELKIMEVTERICDIKRDEGDWLQWIDMVEQDDDTIALEVQPYPGECRTECKTIEKACQDIMAFSDTDVAEYLYNEPQAGHTELVAFMCANTCKGPKPKAPKGRKAGEAFLQKSEREVERQRMLRDLDRKHEKYAEEHPNAPRMPKMKLYSREDLLKNPMLTGKEDDDDDDDDDEDGDTDATAGATSNAGSTSSSSGSGDDEMQKIAEAMRSAEAAKARSSAEHAQTGSGSTPSSHNHPSSSHQHSQHEAQQQHPQQPSSQQRARQRRARGGVVRRFVVNGWYNHVLPAVESAAYAVSDALSPILSRFFTGASRQKTEL